MIKRLIVALVISAMGLPALAGGTKQEHHTNNIYSPDGNLIVVSCYRGPLSQVIWDRPNAVFVDSLVSVGYDFSTASAIAERVCRDQDLVGDSAALKASMERIWYDPATHRRHNY